MKKNKQGKTSYKYIKYHLVDKMNPENLEKEIVTRIKRIKCEQKGCRSSNTETQEIVVFNLASELPSNEE